jgi:hypothetical protein
LTIIMALVGIGLFVWVWLAYQDLAALLNALSS